MGSMHDFVDNAVLLAVVIAPIVSVLQWMSVQAHNFLNFETMWLVNISRRRRWSNEQLSAYTLVRGRRRASHEVTDEKSNEVTVEEKRGASREGYVSIAEPSIDRRARRATHDGSRTTSSRTASMLAQNFLLEADTSREVHALSPRRRRWSMERMSSYTLGRGRRHASNEATDEKKRREPYDVQDEKEICASHAVCNAESSNDRRARRSSHDCSQSSLPLV